MLNDGALPPIEPQTDFYCILSPRIEYKKRTEDIKMHYRIDSNQTIAERKISETSYYAEVPYSEEKLSLYLEENAVVNGNPQPQGEIEIPLYVGFNNITVNDEKLTILRYADESILMHEHFRPRFHYTVPISLLNDPNGLCYDKENDLYHMYYQYQGNYEEGKECKSWGHCVSRDLLHWKQLQNAIYPDALGEAFSGSCVIDEENTSGLFDSGTPKGSRIAALYTSFDGVERQCLAFSKDGGTTFEKYPGNPVIDNFENGKQKYTLGFRDPKVIRVKTKHYPNGVWLMVVAGEQARLFSSENLINWTLNDEFFYPDGEKIISECPDFFPMQTQDGEEKWVFLGNDYNDGNSRIFYVVGNLSEDEAGRLHFEAQTDGKNSMNLNPEAYASQTFYNDKKGRRIMIAWLRDWVLFDGTAWKFENINKYSKYWLGTFTLPQELFLTKENGEYRMLARPVEEVNFLRKSKIFSSVNSFMSSVIIRKTKFLDMEFRAKTDNFRNPLQLRISGENKESGEEIDEEVVITYDAGTRLFRLDKSKTPGAFVPVYSYITEKPDIFSFRLITDTSVLEIYLNDGEKVLSTQFYIRGKHRFELNFDGISEYLNAYEPLTDRAECYINSKV